MGRDRSDKGWGDIQLGVRCTERLRGVVVLRQPQTEQEIERLASALGDPTRRRVFFVVREASEPLTKDNVAEAVGIERRLAGFHLDKLVEQGFLTADFRRREVGGPGAGRPPKVYILAATEAAVALPERHYDLLAELLLRAMSEPGASPQAQLETVGFEFGKSLGEEQRVAGASPFTPTQAIAEVVRVLSRYGFAATSGGGSATTIKACACPFEEMAFHDPERVCGLDRSIWKGILSVYAPNATIASTTARAEGDDACVAEVITSSVA
jgi:predicted ArsR family transcriptional regulator